MFDDSERICLTLIPRCRECGPRGSRGRRPGSSGQREGRRRRDDRSSSAPAIVTILNVDPGSYTSVTARLRRASGGRSRTGLRRTSGSSPSRGLRLSEDPSRSPPHHARPTASRCARGSAPRSPGSDGRSSSVTFWPGRSALEVTTSIAPPERVLDDRLEAGPAGERLVERALEPVEAVVVGPGEAEHVRGNGPLRVRASSSG